MDLTERSASSWALAASGDEARERSLVRAAFARAPAQELAQTALVFFEVEHVIEVRERHPLGVQVAVDAKLSAVVANVPRGRAAKVRRNRGRTVPISSHAIAAMARATVSGKKVASRREGTSKPGVTSSRAIGRMIVPASARSARSIASRGRASSSAGTGRPQRRRRRRPANASPSVSRARVSLRGATRKR